MKALAVLVLLCGVADASHHCHETSPIVGREHCGGFGMRWAHDPWLGLLGYEVAVVYEDIGVDPVDAHGNVYSATQMAGYHIGLAPGTRHHMHTLGPRMRWGYRTLNATFAFEMTAGFPIASPSTVTAVDGFAPANADGGTMFDIAGVVGYHERWGALQLGGELAVGMRTISLGAQAPPGFTTCEGGATGKGCYLAPYDSRLLVEPRARIDWWLTPHLEVGVLGGVDVAARGESVSAIIAYHLAAYDGS